MNKQYTELRTQRKLGSDAAEDNFPLWSSSPVFLRSISAGSLYINGLF